MRFNNNNNKKEINFCYFQIIKNKSRTGSHKTGPHSTTQSLYLLKLGEKFSKKNKKVN